MLSILDLIADIPTNAVLRLRAQALEKKVGELEAEISRLVKRIGELDRQISANAGSDQFVEHRGVLFKRKPGGGYVEQPYCFVCRKPMSSHMGLMAYGCMCGYFADFTGSQLAEVMR